MEKVICSVLKQQKHLLKTYLIQLMFVRLAVSACQNIHVYVFSFLSTILHFC